MQDGQSKEPKVNFWDFLVFRLLEVCFSPFKLLEFSFSQLQREFTELQPELLMDDASDKALMYSVFLSLNDDEDRVHKMWEK